jgi:hypothetical protein
MFHCGRCGTFAGASATWLKVESAEHVVRLAGWVRDQNALGEHPFIKPETSRRVASMPLPKLRDRARRVLRYLSHETPNVEAWYDLRSAANDVELWGRSYSKDANEGLVLRQLLIRDGLLTGDRGLFHLSVDGLIAIEDMGATQTGTAQGFVAMSFDPSLNDAWINGFDAAIRAAGYTPMRVDNKEYIGGISDEVMAEIRRSRFVVVDYTGQRSSVYFEAASPLDWI